MKNGCALFAFNPFFTLHSSFKKRSDSGGIQTHNLLIRSQMLYSVELRSQSVMIINAKK